MKMQGLFTRSSAFVMGLLFLMSALSTTSGCNNGQQGSVTVSAKNDIQDPTFNISVEVEWRHQPALKFLEKAANLDEKFRFTASYFDSELGYYINAINGLAGNYAANKTYWLFTNSSDVPHGKGISNYWPEQGEEICFVFTTDEPGSHA